MIERMESIHHEHGDSDDMRSGGAAAFTVAASTLASVDELTERELELQRRLVRESLLLRPA